MGKPSRRGALAFGVAMAAAPPVRGAPDAYGPEAGVEIAPGVRQVYLGNAPILLPGYRIISMSDLIFRPGSGQTEDSAKHDRICFMVKGLLRVRTGGHEALLHSDCQMWTYTKGVLASAINTGAETAVLRTVDLFF